MEMGNITALWLHSMCVMCVSVHKPQIYRFNKIGESIEIRMKFELMAWLMVDCFLLVSGEKEKMSAVQPLNGMAIDHIEPPSTII